MRGLEKEPSFYIPQTVEALIISKKARNKAEAYRLLADFLNCTHRSSDKVVGRIASRSEISVTAGELIHSEGGKLIVGKTSVGIRFPEQRVEADIRDKGESR